ncbi:hypothetical protein P7C71_g2035, partial [Lecanoromycetidae sp. Uapishka_2]
MRPILGHGREKISKKPSSYPPLPFHLIRIGQLLSALIVFSVLIFFIHQLHLEHYYIPWTFLLLLTVSALSIVSHITTSIFHFSGILNARTNLLANLALTILWLLGLALLTWNLGWTLGHRCTTATWHNSDGIMVCRLYKACTAFTVTATVSTLLALGLDLHVQRDAKARGVYNQMLDIKGPTDVHSSSPFHHNDDLNASMPDIRVSQPSTDLQRPYKAQRPFEAGQFGYEQPEEQTSYGGGGGHEWDDRL